MYDSIMKTMARVLKLSEVLLLAQAGMWVLAARIGLFLLPFGRLQRLVALLTRGTHAPSFSDDRVSQLTWAVSSASRFVPQATCLTKALALHILLRRAGFQSRIHIGVRREDGRFEAHAWVESQDKVVIGDFELKRYCPILVWD
jgi:hypothetical protein